MSSANATVFQTLSEEPVLGHSLGRVTVLRLDLLGGAAPGNKAFKLRPYLEQAKSADARCILSFGGAWSNHLHALAAMGAEMELDTVGFVRGGECDNPMLSDVRRWGMRVVPLTREQYRLRHQHSFQQGLLQTHGPGLMIAEGGSDREGVLGCLDIAELINRARGGWSRVVLPVGTGTTLAGLAAGLDPGMHLQGISALKNASDLERRVTDALTSAGLRAQVPWVIEHDFHCGGFARVSESLRHFMLACEATHGLPLEPVYTGKMLFAVQRLRASGRISPEEALLLVHTGGLQGRRGYPWLAP